MTETNRERAVHLLRRAHHHEIRGALNALRLQLTLLQRGRERIAPDDPRFGQWVDAAAAEAGAVERALEELSAVERVDEAVSNDDPSAIAERVAQLLEPLARSQRVELSVEPAPEGVRTTGTLESSPGCLAQQLLGLGATALAEAEPGDTLILRVNGDEIEVSPGSAHP